MLPDPWKCLCATMLLPLAAVLLGCASSSQMLPQESLWLPPPPSLTTPLPATNYSLDASEAIKNWREKRMATRLISDPLSTPGR